MTNLSSSLCGAFVGIPVVLLVVQQISTAQVSAVLDRRNGETAKVLVGRLRGTVDGVVPGMFADMGFLWGVSRRPGEAVRLLGDLRRELDASRRMSDGTAERLSRVRVEHLDTVEKYHQLDAKVLDVRAIWLTLKPTLLALRPRAGPVDVLAMVAAVDRALEEVSHTAGLSFDEIVSLWSNWEEEEQKFGTTVVTLRFIDLRIERLRVLSGQLGALTDLFTTLDGVAHELRKYLEEAGG